MVNKSKAQEQHRADWKASTIDCKTDTYTPVAMCATSPPPDDEEQENSRKAKRVLKQQQQ